MNTLKHVYAFAIGTRLITSAFGVASYLWTASYDSSGDIVLNVPLTDASIIQRSLTAFLRWDALYFIHIAQYGYVYEQEHAFFPGIPLLMRFLTQSVLSPLIPHLGEQHTLLLSGVIISNLSFVLAAGMLYKLGRSLFPSQPALALLSAVAFCLSPPAMFMSSVYTESTFALLTFAGMLWYTKQHYLVAALLWGLSTAIRSNGIVYVGFFAYDLVWRRFLNRQPLWKIAFGALRCVIYSIITFTGFLAFQYYGYTQFCVDSPQSWCANRVPLLYSYVQKEYWDNGFLAYYEVKQIPNFLLAAPIIALTFYGLQQFVKRDWKRFWSLGLCPSTRDASGEYDRLAPFMYLWGFLLVYATTCMHVQVIIRFFTSMPPLYWCAAQLWINGFKDSKTGMSRHIANATLFYYILYGLVGIVLFAAFLPPA